MSEQVQARGVLIMNGGNSLGRAIALNLGQRPVHIILSDEPDRQEALQATAALVVAAGGQASVLPPSSDEDVLRATYQQAGRLDCLINLFLPRRDQDVGLLYAYPGRLIARGLAAGELLAASTPHGAIINYCSLPALYAGTDLMHHMAAFKGAMTGATRELCCKLGRQGITANCIQTGLIDLPETQSLVSDRVRAVKVPMGRWATAEDVARLVAFLTFKNRYWTGQSILLDGGLTSGITAT